MPSGAATLNRRAGLTQPGITMGTIDYMAPEQWENSATADIRADIYSLGCTLFFLLTGKPPYGDPAYDTNRKKLMAHVVAPIPSLAGQLPRLPPGPGRSLRDDDGQGPARALRGSGGSGRGHGRIRRRGRTGRGDCRHADRRRLDCREQRQSSEPRGGHGQAAGGRIRGVQRPPPLAKPADRQAEIPSERSTGSLRIAAGRDRRPLGLGGDAARRRRGEKRRRTSTAAASSTASAHDRAATPHSPRRACRRFGPAARAERPVVVRRNALADAVPAAGDCRQSAARRLDLAAVLGDHPPVAVSRSQYGRGAEVALGSGADAAAATCRQASGNCWTSSRPSPDGSRDDDAAGGLQPSTTRCNSS